jgi:urease accessory protein
MERDARLQRGDKPFVFTNVRQGIGIDPVVEFVIKQGMLSPSGN